MDKHLFAVAMVAGISGTSIHAQIAVAKPTLSIAFPKAVDRVETAKLYGRYLVHIGECAKVNLVNQRGEAVDSYFNGVDLLGEQEVLAGLKHGKLDIAQLSSGIVPVAVEASAVVPFAIRGNSKTQQIGTYRLLLIVRADSPYRKPADLKGRKIAHTTPASNSGNLAPRAYFPSLGLTAEKDYEVVYSKGHERSIAGVQNGFWHAGAVASDQFDRMVAKSEIRASAFRVLWESPPFPVSAFVFGAQVPKALQERVGKCTYQYRFPADTQRLLDASDTFLPVDYDKHYAPVTFILKVGQKTGVDAGK
jgi:phosphonate transport system substrate-binding protein